MNGFDLFRLIWLFFACAAANWNMWTWVGITIAQFLWVWEYNSTVKKLEAKIKILEAKYDEATKRNNAIETGNSQT